ncbi:MAG: hypothetical protein IPN37_03325 [Betaproteobacteria bacterium]|nr:hypothetical protein [Betaproteobacteria bacterium]
MGFARPVRGWKHELAVNYFRGPWVGTFSQSYVSGYKDEVPAGVVPPGFEADVDSYTVYNISATYNGIRT